MKRIRISGCGIRTTKRNRKGQSVKEAQNPFGGKTIAGGLKSEGANGIDKPANLLEMLIGCKQLDAMFHGLRRNPYIVRWNWGSLPL